MIMALFLTKPALYSDVMTQKYRQTAFFEKFWRFASAYYKLKDSDADARVYFSSFELKQAGDYDICGGAGKLSGASKSYFKKRFHGVEMKRESSIEAFQRKYRMVPGKDTRLFLGVGQIWDKLNEASKIVAGSYWPDVASLEYSDPTLTAPANPNVIKLLIPLEFRNRALQKFSKRQGGSSIIRYATDEPEEDVVRNPTPACDDEDW